MAREQAALQLTAHLLKLLQTFHEVPVRLDENVYFDIVRRTVIRNGQAIKLTKRENDLLCYLLQRSGTPVTANELLQSVWAEAEQVSESNLYQYVRKLRKKLEEDPTNPKILLTCRKGERGLLIRRFEPKDSRDGRGGLL